MSVSPGKQVILIGMNGRYNLSLQCVSCPSGKSCTYEDLKITATGMSRQAFVSMLEHRTKVFGRSGQICGDTMQKSFLEWIFTKFEVERLSHVNFTALRANRNLMDLLMVFLAKDAEVSSFVDYIHGTTKHNPAKGTCGTGQWVAARESASKLASKLDEEGVEVAVCRHGVLLKGLNMFCGKIFAYPLYLQKQFFTD